MSETMYVIPAEPKPVKIVFEDSPVTTVAAAFAAFQKSPCYDCSMIASLHAHTPEQAANFKFNCSIEKEAACRALHHLRLQGAPGAQGWDGSSDPPTPEKLESMRAHDKLVNDAYWAQIESLRKILEG